MFDKDAYLMALARACCAWSNPPKWSNDYEREVAEGEWYAFLNSVIPAQEILAGDK